MYTYGYGYYGFDWTYLLLVIGMLLSLLASAKLKSTFARYKRVRSASGLTGEEAARRILYSAGITDVQVRPIAGSLTDALRSPDEDSESFTGYLRADFAGSSWSCCT